ncbi:desiccation-related protein PCC13-62-like [Hibiscus syriacus]|uniref:desiccation-related protein PCC13-62-like n=1 Tax=Hibiscus syriacus TaxID=106335 RepID=UPI0019206EDB|nr:desiccation-related protein PCC13-62-like [Hibiscus syriacus]
MATTGFLFSTAIVFISLSVISLLPSAISAVFSDDYKNSSVPKTDLDLLEFPLNLEYLEAEFFLFGALGQGLDKVAPHLAEGGPSPIGAQKANLDTLTNAIILQFAYQEVGHLKVIKKIVKGFPRPQLDLSASLFAKVIDKAFGKPLNPPFDPYANSINFFIVSYLIPYVGLTGYVGANPKLQSAISKRLVAGLLGVESGLVCHLKKAFSSHVKLNKDNYSDISARVRLKKRELEQIQISTLNGNNYLVKELNVQKELNDLEETEYMFLKQKSKAQWIKDGDNCTKLFHSTLASKIKRDTIRILVNNEGKRLET